MAKPTFAKMGLKAQNDIKTITIGEQEIEVKQYLPIQKKLDLISNVANFSADANNFANPVKIDVFFSLEVMYHYTNITFTDKQKEDFIKTFDLLKENGVLDKVRDAIPSEEYYSLYDDTLNCISEIYKYRNSVLGIMDTIRTDYNEVGSDLDEFLKQMGDEKNMEFLKTVVTKLG